MKDVTVAMVALGGYGNTYLARLFGNGEHGGFRLVAGIDPDPKGCRYLDAFKELEIPIYADLDHFYAESAASAGVDLVVIAAPISLHLPFTHTALAHGSNVLCEKPVTATIQDALQMAAAEAAAGGFVGIGYQWSFSDTIQALKADIVAGVLGKPLRFRTKVLWPRPHSYYHRNNWAAKLKTANGSWVLDSPVNNATAHYLHNCFYVLGETRETSARPVDVQAELYRANDIENYDTAAVRCHTEDGVEILFYAAHPVNENIGPVLSYEFENAVVEYEARDTPMVARFKDGRVKDYGSPFANEGKKLWDAIEASRTGAPLACSISAAMSHTLAVNGAQESVESILDFPDDLVRRYDQNGDELLYVEGLVETLGRCYDQGVMPSELGDVPWAKIGRVVDLRDYRHYPSSEAPLQS
ncbi:MAG: Gfo/Idh/MocA family oxidoreductase [Anaerolineae bacterium]|nr:Gfo/Idh/MocA family oxidoreductase [Anaerolineae bacterium]